VSTEYSVTGPMLTNIGYITSYNVSCSSWSLGTRLFCMDHYLVGM